MKQKMFWKGAIMSKLIAWFLVLISLITGCKKESLDSFDKVPIKFTVNAFTIENSKSIDSKTYDKWIEFLKSAKADEVTQCKVGLDGTTTTPLEFKTLSFTLVDGKGESEVTEIVPGIHSLTALQLLNIDDEVLFSAVKSDAFLAQFVTEIIPKSFNVVAGAGTAIVSMDVVALEDWTPGDFGYGSFTIGINTVYGLYFYGAQYNNDPSVMTMVVTNANGTTYSSSSEDNPNKVLKTYFVDSNERNNATEMVTFELVKDGIELIKTMSVADLLLVPQEIILLNVLGSGMWGFTLAEEPLTISITKPTPDVEYCLIAIVSGGTAPLVITWWNNAECTIPALFGGIQITGTPAIGLSDALHWAKVTDNDGDFEISNSDNPTNTDLGVPTYLIEGTVMTATGHGGYTALPYVYEWFRDDILISTGNVLDNQNIVGVYKVKVTDAIGQNAEVIVTTVVPIENLHITFSLNRNGAFPPISIIVRNSLNTIVFNSGVLTLSSPTTVVIDYPESPDDVYNIEFNYYDVKLSGVWTDPMTKNAVGVTTATLKNYTIVVMNSSNGNWWLFI